MGGRAARSTEPMTWREYVRHVAGEDRQVEISTRTGIDQGTISRWMREDQAPISPRSVRMFATGYRVPVLEAFIVAGFLSESEAGISAPRERQWSDVSDAELAAEVR